MYAFEDINNYSYGSSERKRSRKKKLIIIGAALLAVTLIVVAGVVGALFYTNNESKKAEDSSDHNMHSVSKSVKMMCSTTDYSGVCESSISKAVNSSSPAPEDLVKAAVAVIINEAKKAFSRSELFKSKNPMIRGAIEDCKQLYMDSKEELETALEHITAYGLENLPKRSHDIRTWLSAVMSYQQTCIDGFPDGELKTKMNEAMNKARQLTSNALAIIKEASSFFSTLKLSNFNRRRLLEEEEHEEMFVDDDGYPSWVAEGDRRMLKEYQWKKPAPNVTVAKDGSGDFTTITDALNAMPKKYQGRYVIYVKAGEYEETVNVTKKMVNVTMYGDGSKKTIITGSKNFIDGTRTFQTATFVAAGSGFMAVGICFRNTAGAIKHQAVALRVQSDLSVFLYCRMEGYQDTLYAQTHRQFYRGCVISGTIDFIFGDAAAVIQNSVLVVRRPLDNQQNIVTANGRVDPHETTGFVLHNCRIIPDHRLSSNLTISSYLGRPWKQFSKTIIMESRIGSFIHPDGYTPWNGDFALKTLFYAEYNNTGPGSDVTARVPWPGFKVITRPAAMRFTVANFLQGRDWIKATGAPVRLGLYH
ncbi:hypothetical protein J5N97_005814 [Dioscorea zingiberensis]|uniref:Pectinesterase n=1 Tax=Dioscorea zingiberensis TaxID=325984 RepID=A0A9D5DAW9_9LILI|nr:hypothetical protein J5N97_005814 [Dioscorea zingiberensis]